MAYSPSQYAEALYELLDAHPHQKAETVKAFAAKLIEHGKANRLRDIISEYERITLEKKHLTPVRIESAAPHTVSASAIARALKTEIELVEHIDPNLGAGLRITIGDYRIDNTLKRRLDDLKSAFI